MNDLHPADQPAAVRQGEAIDVARLAAHLLAQLPGASGPLEVAQFPRGYSNLTYLLRLGGQELVLRRPPFGANVKAGHDMQREYRMLASLIAVYPRVPRPLLYCEDADVIGAPFYVMERVYGVILRPPLPDGVALAPVLAGQVSAALVDTLADLHAVDYRAAGLADLGRPDGYVERQIAGWSKRYASARTHDLPVIERVAAWLASHTPRESGAALIHNDFKHDNVVLDPHDLTRVVAVLDWEMATVGDPLMDLGTTLGYWIEPGDPPALQQLGLTGLPGTMGRRTVAERYAARSGRSLDQVLFYYVYGLFKIAVIIQQIYARYHHGHTSDPRFADLLAMVRAFGDLADRAVAAGRIDDL